MPPDWLGPANPQWQGARGVRFWRQEWRDILFSGAGTMLEPILAAGYDGAFLDRVDAYMDWIAERPRAAQDMMDLVEAVAATARRARPGFLLIGQNAEPLLAEPRYRAVIDAVSKESLFYGLQGAGIANSAADVAWSRKGLDAARQAGLPVFTIEYLDDAATATEVQRAHRALGYVPFIATRQLERLPGSHLP
jgi:cysteinyl-tRNA synthetase